MFLGLFKYESTSYICTLFDIQCCQCVIRKSVYGFMDRLDSSVLYIIHIAYNLLHVMFDDTCIIIILTSYCYLLDLCAYDTVESGIK